MALLGVYAFTQLLLLLLSVCVVRCGGVQHGSASAAAAPFLHGSFGATTSLVVTSPPTKHTAATAVPTLYDDGDEQSFVAIKPDAVQRNLIGEVILRFEAKGLKVVAMKMIRPDEAVVMEHYHEHKNAPFFHDLVGFFKSGPIVALVVQGKNAIHIARKLIGKTQPEDAEPGTIRGDYCLGKGRNLVHSSDSADSAKREIALWFRPEEILTYRKTIDGWVNLQPPPDV